MHAFFYYLLSKILTFYKYLVSREQEKYFIKVIVIKHLVKEERKRHGIISLLLIPLTCSEFDLE